MINSAILAQFIYVPISSCCAPAEVASFGWVPGGWRTALGVTQGLAVHRAPNKRANLQLCSSLQVNPAKRPITTSG